MSSAKSEYRREWRARNPDKVRAYARATARALRADPTSPLNRRIAVTRLLLDVMRAVPCADCGGRFPAVCLDFDHRPSETKVTEVSVLARGYRPSVFIAEAAKCDVVCSNCHRLRTQERMQA